ncbi:hypothetical protein [Streptacidiphilus sp. EB103A]|uniref:hypothetical protein n=1 Tax=Streptacidiphilus sp. EB103A TaxID=3156275 RepID=UPI003510FDFF
MTGPTETPQLPFHIGFDSATGQLVLSMTFGVPPKQTVKSQVIRTLDQVAVEIALHRHEARLQHLLAQHLADAAVRHFGADRARLEAAVQALSDPDSTTPVGRILRGPAATSG